jgi:hypothetical protein
MITNISELNISEGFDELTDYHATKTNVDSKYKDDPTCPKCGIILGNKMLYCCQNYHCPVGLN